MSILKLPHVFLRYNRHVLVWFLVLSLYKLSSNIFIIYSRAMTLFVLVYCTYFVSITAFLEMWNSYEVSRIPMNVIGVVSLCFYLGALYYSSIPPVYVLCSKYSNT